MDNEYEPLPKAGCQHAWANIGKPFVMAASTSTAETPDIGGIILQKRRCFACGGVGTFPAQTAEGVEIKHGLVVEGGYGILLC